MVLTVQLSDEEIKLVVLDKNEYSDSKWISMDDLLSSDYHPALKVSARALLARSKLDEMRLAVTAGASDTEVACLARELCALSEPPSFGRSEYTLKNAELGYEATVHVSSC